MSERIARVATAVINVIDYQREKDFWSALLGVGVAREVPGFFCWLEPQHEGGISVALQKVPDPTPGRNRVHFDTGVADLEKAQEQIVELGGSHLEDHEVAGYRWKVMSDPEGNEFCIAAER